ncbi:MAG: rod-binding protein [Roseinatronobacter sp.]|jgi:peptidoglycan hydrolase FlgJ|nr:rod-binding protein [Roseinatronobacter sp.]
MDIPPLATRPLPELRTTNTPAPADLRAAAEGFESLFLAELLKGGRASLPGDDLTGSQAVSMAQDMLDRHLAQHAAGQAGLGVAAAILRQFGPKAE